MFLKFFSLGIFLFPWLYLVKVPLQKGSLNWLDIALLVYLSLSAGQLYQKKKLKSFLVFLQTNKLFWFFGFLVFCVFLSALSGGREIWSNLGILKSFFVLPGLFAFLLAFQNRKKTFWVKDYLLAYLIYSSGLSLASLLSFCFGETSYDNRISLFFQSPNQLAILLSTGFLITIFFRFFYQKVFLNNLWWLNSAIAVHFLAIATTQSTGAIFSLTVLIGFLLFHKNSLLPNLTILLLILQILSLTIIFNASFLLNIFSIDPFENKNSLDSRLVIYSVSEKIIEKNPFSGIGPASFQESYLREQKNFPPYPQWAVPHSHNLFSQIWLSGGLAGLVFFIFLFIQKILYAKTSSSNKKQIFLSFLIINYFLLHGLIDTPIWKNDLALFFWFFLLIDKPENIKRLLS